MPFAREPGLYIECDQEEVKIEKGMAVYIPPGVKRGVKKTVNEDLSMVYIFSYPRYPTTKIAE